MNEETIRRIAADLNTAVRALETLVDNFDALEVSCAWGAPIGRYLPAYALSLPCRELGRVYNALSDLKRELCAEAEGGAK